VDGSPEDGVELTTKPDAAPAGGPALAATVPTTGPPLVGSATAPDAAAAEPAVRAKTTRTMKPASAASRLPSIGLWVAGVMEAGALFVTRSLLRHVW
jgi:hypothetical protein